MPSTSSTAEAPRRRTLAVHRLGRVGYRDAVALMEALADARRRGAVGDTLLLVEHPHVITVSRRTPPEHLLLDRDALAARGVAVEPTRRGGDVTYHGPGQLVAYPVVDLNPDRRDVRAYVRGLEEVMIRTAARFGVDARRADGLVGVWVGAEKLGALGVHIARWVTSHGIALNVNTDLAGFRLIVPCGLGDRGVTSLAKLTGRVYDLREVGDALVRAFAEVFDTAVVEAGPPRRAVVVRGPGDSLVVHAAGGELPGETAARGLAAWFGAEAPGLEDQGAVEHHLAADGIERRRIFRAVPRGDVGLAPARETVYGEAIEVAAA